MTEIIELLYINKTQHESLDDFLENTIICSFCADKLRGNKEVAWSAFNHLSVIPTPTCIKQLNIKSGIKSCYDQANIRAEQTNKTLLTDAFTAGLGRYVCVSNQIFYSCCSFYYESVAVTASETVDCWSSRTEETERRFHTFCAPVVVNSLPVL